jgi:23S rRNA (pseudouridine1915-N3)-methyltransferase
MRIDLIVVGKLKDGPERELFARYGERLDALGRAHALGPLKLIELPESRASGVEERKADEAVRILKATVAGSFLVALDEGGRAQSSAAFADLVRRQRDDAMPVLALAIGGPDGHGKAVLAAAQLKLSLGAMTLPHGLARVVVVEQLYRAATIIAGHPYHRV